MLYLVFQLGGERYIVEAAQVVEILPLIEVRPVPQAPHGVVGVFNYRGVALPLLDLSVLALGRPSQIWLSTRIVLIGNEKRQFGMIVEHATETIRLEPSEFAKAATQTGRTPYLSGVAADEQGLIQQIDVNVLLSDEWNRMLFGPVGTHLLGEDTDASIAN